MLKVFLTLALIAVVMIAIIKKFHPVSVIFGISILALIIYSYATGVSMLGEQSTGVLAFDVFEFIVNQTKTQLAGNILVGLMFTGYIAFMDRLHASELFGVYVGGAFAKVKAPYVLTSILTVLCCFMKLFLGSAIVVVMLLVSVLYVPLKNIGCTNATICASMVLGTAITWGPTDGGVVATPGLAGSDMDSAAFFLTYQFLPCCIALIVMATVSFFTSKMYDKKEAAAGIVDEVVEVKDLGSIDAPKYYAVLPILPLLFVIIFSGSIKGVSVTLSTACAVLVAFAIALLVHIFSNLKKFVEAFNDCKYFFLGQGNALGNYLMIIVAGTVLSQTIQKIGGMTILIEWLNGLGGGKVLLCLVGSILAFFVTAATVSYMANLNIFVPFFATIAKVTGADPLRLAALANNSCGLGTALTPASNTMLFLTGMLKTDVVTTIKRNVIPILSGLATIYILQMIL